ncbi:MAG: class I SAM-dependent methyltransferase [Burkholderiaceae bacterium]
MCASSFEDSLVDGWAIAQLSISGPCLSVKLPATPRRQGQSFTVPQSRLSCQIRDLTHEQASRGTEDLDFGHTQMTGTSATQPSAYQWRAAFYHLEEEDLGDIDFYRRCLARISGRVLVIPSGSGRLISLTDLRTNLFFADIEPEMVRVLRKRLTLAGIDPRFGMQANILDLQAAQPYEAIIVPAESLQMFEHSTLSRLFRSLSAASTPGGLVTVDVATFSPSCAGKPESPRYYRPDLHREDTWEQWRRHVSGDIWLTRQVRHEDEDTSVHFTFTYRMEAGTQPTTKTATVRLWRHSLDSILGAASGAGLSAIACHESYADANASGSRHVIEFVRK